MTNNTAPALIDDRPTIDDIAITIRSLRASFRDALRRNDLAAMRNAQLQHDAAMRDFRARILAGERINTH